jgi:hypothetical protein
MAKEPTELTPEQVAALQAWNELKSSLDATKQSEMESRLAAIKALPWEKPDKEDGGQTLPLFGGWRAELKRVVNYSVENDPAKVMDCLNEIGLSNPGLAAELIRWEPVLSTEAFKRCTNHEKEIMARVITTKPGTPSLALKAPAPKKD